ncbi:MAG: hypothetical protein AAF741_11580 [Bacteroidota bacterium]
MRYSEKALKEVLKKHDVPNATIATWKHRGRIPDKYLKNSIEEVSDEQTRKLTKAISDKRINRTSLGIDSMKSRDAARGKSRFLVNEYEEHILALKKLTQDLIKLSKTETGIRSMIEDNRIKRFLLFGRLISNRSYRPFYNLSDEELKTSASSMNDLANWIEKALS